MNDKRFSCTDGTTFQTFSTQFGIIPGTCSPTGTFNDVFTTLLPQNSADRIQNKPIESTYLFPDLLSWDNLKFPEKIDSTETISKDLISTGHYNNVDVLTLENQYNKFESTQWSNSAGSTYPVKSANYPSCAEVEKYYGNYCKTSTYCSIQKNSVDNYKSCAFYNTSCSFTENNKLTHNGQYANQAICYDPKYSDSSCENFFCNQNSLDCSTTVDSKSVINQKECFDINNLSVYASPDQQTEASNDESDIVVEESISDCSEEHERGLFYEITKCFLCDTQYTPLGLQFYVLTAESPLTMSSQVPVKNKILEFINCRENMSDKSYLCNNCLCLVNTIDHLQLKLNNLMNSLVERFNVYCLNKNSTKKIDKSNSLPVETQNKLIKRTFRYKCKQCKRILYVKKYLDNHLKRHKRRVYLCEMCGNRFFTYKKFKYHLNNHRIFSVEMIPAFKCSNQQCDKIFKKKFHLKEHENFCLGLLPFKCKHLYCNKKFPSATKLKNHTKLKHEKKFIAICSICNIGFVKVSEYKSHMISHSTDKKFPCNKCDKSYKTLSNLNFHLKSHEKVLPFICIICQKGFMRKEYHEAHMNNHKGIKSFSCSVCEKKFVSQKNLDAHLKYHEGNVKSNTCNICKKVITSCFEEHLRVHSNYKEFECHMCDMKFNTKNSLNKHRKRKHPNEKAVK